MGRPSIAGHEWIHHQHRRQEATQLSEASVQSTEIIATSVSATGSQTDTPTSTTSVPQTEQTIPPVPDSSNPPTLPTPFPQPYDTLGVASGVKTQGCQTFFQNMTQSEAFRTCRPFSLLLQYSTEFIEVRSTHGVYHFFCWHHFSFTRTAFFSFLFLFFFWLIFVKLIHFYCIVC